MTNIVIMVVACIVTISGDYFVKLASQGDKGIASLTFVVGAFLYGLPAVAWYYLMRDHSLAVIGVFYSCATIILMTGLSVFVFKESFGLRDGLGVALALMAVAVSVR